MEIPILKDLLVIFCLSILVVLICHKARIPPLVGFLFTGVLSGPHALQLVTDTKEVEVLSKVGIILLLFTIGVEFSLKRIFRYKRYFLFGGSLQVGCTILAGVIIACFLNRPVSEAIFLGFLLSLSSTAIVLRIQEARSESASSQGRLSTGILIFQDFVVVPMMLLVPALAGVREPVDGSMWFLLAKGILLVLFVIFLATKVIPRLFYIIAETRFRELFLLSVLVICFAVAYLSDWLGLSLSIGAFLAGLIISESEYGHQAIGDILPLRDLFASLFFISIGMLLDVEFLFSYFPLILTVSLGVMLLKWAITTFSGIAIGVPLRSVLLTSFAICQIGEFSFILAKAGLDAGIGTYFYHELFLAVAVITMGLTPFLIQHSHTIVDWILRLPIPTKYATGYAAHVHVEETRYKNHVIIAGYGLSGRLLASNCKKIGIPYLIVDINAKTVQQASQNNVPIMFGDASHEVILKQLDISLAKTLAIAISDMTSTLRIIKHAKKLNPKLYILCRTRYLEESEALFEHGADEVIPDELGSSIELFSRVLHFYKVPKDDIENLELEVQNAVYERRLCQRELP